jgi:hypothetical protein
LPLLVWPVEGVLVLGKFTVGAPPEAELAVLDFWANTALLLATTNAAARQYIPIRFIHPPDRYLGTI